MTHIAGIEDEQRRPLPGDGYELDIDGDGNGWVRLIHLLPGHTPLVAKYDTREGVAFAADTL